MLRWLRGNLIAAGQNIERLCLSEALDAVMVLGSTFRAMPYDDFDDVIHGREVKKDDSGGSGQENVSLNQILQMAGATKKRA